jgi:hypothetical protein
MTTFKITMDEGELVKFLKKTISMKEKKQILIDWHLSEYHDGLVNLLNGSSTNGETVVIQLSDLLNFVNNYTTITMCKASDCRQWFRSEKMGRGRVREYCRTACANRGRQKQFHNRQKSNESVT